MFKNVFDDRNDRENNNYSSFFPDRELMIMLWNYQLDSLKEKYFFFYICLLQDTAGIALGIPELKKNFKQIHEG